jgi:hypothetical protein
MLYLGSAAVVLVIALVVALALRSDDDKDGKSGTPGDPTSTPTASTSDSPGPPKSLASFTGSGDKTTTSFEAAANWEVRWQTEADPTFTVELLDKDGTSRGQIVAAKKKTKGSVFVSEAGDFKLKVTASGDWSIRILGKSAD